MQVKIAGIIGTILFLLGMSAATLLAQNASPTSASTRDGVYTVQQAQQGSALYTQQCVLCHGPSLEGKGQNPPLVGDDFVGNWQGQTVADLFARIRTTMPATKPGSLSPAETAQVIAFLLESNKFPAGKTALPTDPVQLKTIRIDTPQTKP